MVLTGPRAVKISIYSIVTAFVIFSAFLMYEGTDPIVAYWNIFAFALDPTLGLPTMLHRSFFILFAAIAFIIPYRAGLWNIGMEGQFYLGTIGAFAVAYSFPELEPIVLIPLMLLGGAILGAGYGALAGHLRGRFNVNEVVVTLMLNNVAFWLVYLLTVGGPWTSAIESSSRPLPVTARAPWIWITPFTSILAVLIAIFIYVFLKYTSIGFQINISGSGLKAAKHVGVDVSKISLIVMAMGGAVAGLSGYHMWAGDPSFYMIPRPEAYKAVGDLTYWGIIIGLVGLLNPVSAIPLSLFIGSILVGSTVLVRRMQLPFGLDYLLLGIISISFVIFQLLHYYRIKVTRAR